MWSAGRVDHVTAKIHADSLWSVCDGPLMGRRVTKSNLVKWEVTAQSGIVDRILGCHGCILYKITGGTEYSVVALFEGLRRDGRSGGCRQLVRKVYSVLTASFLRTAGG